MRLNEIKQPGCDRCGILIKRYPDTHCDRCGYKISDEKAKQARNYRKSGGEDKMVSESSFGADPGVRLSLMRLQEIYKPSTISHEDVRVNDAISNLKYGMTLANYALSGNNTRRAQLVKEKMQEIEQIISQMQNM